MSITISTAQAQQAATWYSPVAGATHPCNNIPIDVKLTWGSNDPPAVTPLTFKLLKQLPNQIGYTDITVAMGVNSPQISHSPPYIRNTGVVGTMPKHFSNDPGSTKYFVRVVYSDAFGAVWESTIEIKLGPPAFSGP